MVAVCEAESVGVAMEKFATVCPAVTNTKEGICETKGLSVVRFTTSPAAGAGAEIVTVPMDLFPPCTVSGFNVRLTGVGSPAG